MSTRPAPRSLLQGLVDDAAVFPPGNAPLEQAWAEHLDLRAGRYGDLVGPLLISPAHAAPLVEVARARPPVVDHETGDSASASVRVGVVARAGTPVADVVDAVSTLADVPAAQVASVEVAHDDDGQWLRALELDLPVAVEVGRDPAGQVHAMDDLVSRSHHRRHPVLLKLRTQSTPAAPVPSPRELADFLDGVRRHALPFKLTGGLHHAVAGDAPRVGGDGTEFQHGVLNVLVATHYLDGRDLPLAGLEAVLELEDPEGLASILRGLDDHDVAALRSRFVSFGCCCVTDPLDELTRLGVLPG